MIKNEEYEGLVEGLGTDGEGIIRIRGATVFVPFCLIGERVRFKVLKVKGNIAYGKLVSVISASPARITPPCGAFGKCGGCDLQHMNYESQLEFKRNAVKSALSKIGGIYVGVNPTVPSANEYRYRNKLTLPIGVDADGKTVVGFYARRSHRIVAARDCAIQAEWVKKITDAVYSCVNGGICGYDEVKKTGVLRHIVVHEIKGKLIITLVAAKNVDPTLLIRELEKSFTDFTFLLNINSAPTNVVFGDKWRIYRGEGFFEAEEGGVKFRIGANTFLQVNDDVRAKLYNKILDETEENCTAIDLYSGGGMLTAMLAKKCGAAYGIEIVEEASRCADELKMKNGLEGSMFNVLGSVEEKIDEVFAKTAGSRRVIVCDPPRKGMERSVVRAISRADADKIVLVSCNPATLARDLGLLMGTLTERDGAVVKAADYNPENSRYTIVSVTPFDMFPQTKWCETLVVLSKKQEKII